MAHDDDAEDVGEDAWDFYPCEIDGARTSVWMNLRYRKGAKPSGADTLYSVCIAMIDVGEHRMGAEAEAEILWLLEDQLDEAARGFGVEYVARIRTNGFWEMTLYGPAGKQAELEASAAGLEWGGRAVTFESRRDADWGRYRELSPDNERWQWMQDRQVVERLEEAGDDPDIPRRVDHWAYFPSETQRRAFVKEALALGFNNDVANRPESTNEQHGARVFRVEQTELESIHASVMLLVVAAERHGGFYDGWETPVLCGT